MTRTAVDTHENWLDPEDLARARRQLPILYINAVPIRVDDLGSVTSVGLLLRSSAEGDINREVIAGRVLYHERIRDALHRHIEKDLGPVALPQLPPSPVPIGVAEYFPTPGVTAYHDPRQHAVALVFAIPIAGDCAPQQDALDLVWLDPMEAAGDAVQSEMRGGHGVVLRQAMAHLGFPPAT